MQKPRKLWKTMYDINFFFLLILCNFKWWDSVVSFINKNPKRAQVRSWFKISQNWAKISDISWGQYNKLRKKNLLRKISTIFLVTLFLWFFAFRGLLYTSCMHWVGLWAPYFIIIYFLYAFTYQTNHKNQLLIPSTFQGYNNLHRMTHSTFQKSKGLYFNSFKPELNGLENPLIILSLLGTKSTTN